MHSASSVFNVYCITHCLFFMHTNIRLTLLKVETVEFSNCINILDFTVDPLRNEWSKLPILQLVNVRLALSVALKNPCPSLGIVLKLKVYNLGKNKLAVGICRAPWIIIMQLWYEKDRNVLLYGPKNTHSL